MYLTLNRESGKMEEWKPPVGYTNRGKNGYFISGGIGGFIVMVPQRGKADCYLWHAPERRLYNVNIDTKEYSEVKIEYDLRDLHEHEPGFMEESEWMQYCLSENVFNSLKNLLDGTIMGNQFDRKRQLKSYEKINANTGGTCGQNIHAFVMRELSDRAQKNQI